MSANPHTSPLAVALFEAFARNGGNRPNDHFDRNAAEQWMQQALDECLPKPAAAQESAPWRDHDAAIDAKALSTATEIALMWGQDRSQFISRIQVAVIDAMRWVKGGLQPAAAQEAVLRIYAEGDMRVVTEWLDGSRDLPDGDHRLYAAPVTAAPVAIFQERSTHSVYRGSCGSLPCYCWAENDHILGDEVKRYSPPDAQDDGAILTNPYTGQPRDYRDVESDPAGMLIVEPSKPLKAASTPAAPGIDNTTPVDRGALQMAINVLRRAGKDEVADALIDASHKGGSDCETCNGRGIFDTDGNGPWDCYACGKKASDAEVRP